MNHINYINTDLQKQKGEFIPGLQIKLRAQKEDLIPSLHIREHRMGKFNLWFTFYIYKSTERGTLSLAYK